MSLAGVFALPRRAVLWAVYSFIEFFEKVVVPRVLLPVVERGLIPDALIRFGIRVMLRGKLNEESSASFEAESAKKVAFAKELSGMPIAINTVDANAQHYEVPAAFYQIVLGPWKKYSSCLWPEGVTTLHGAEEAMLKLVCERADVRDGQHILDLGCGWASCSLWLATHYPNAQVVGLSNSHSQRLHNEREAALRGLTNVRFVTSDINAFDPAALATVAGGSGVVAALGGGADGSGFRFDRVITNEMFEHMKNYRELLARVSSWLKPDGLLFVHIFTHRRYAYHFRDGWMADTFFTGGTMPSHDLLPMYFAEHVALRNHWVVNGQHYAKTLDAWLARHDRARDAVLRVLRTTYGEGQERKWFVFWRLFFLACSECFAYAGGNEWGVSHYLFAKRNAPTTTPTATAAAAADASDAAPAAAAAAGVAAAVAPVAVSRKGKKGKTQGNDQKS